MTRIRVSVVSYLNSKPFISGIEQSAVLNEVELSLDNPATCAQKLLDDEVDIGLVPVAIIPQLKTAHIISDYCIGAVGAVSSVMLYSQVPLENIENIWLDYQSRTSVALTKVLAEQYWKIAPNWLKAAQGFEEKVNETTAAVVIGDRTFELKGRYKYEYDLAAEWHNFTKLPFVFACWVSTKELSSDFLSAFNLALTKGVNSIADLSKEINKTGKYKTDVYKYLNTYISYSLDDEKRKGLKLFLSYLGQK